ncbi:uncharacterized protein BO80DRAFT_376327 [Aspergillus ibericus CBS 121593]|uniref:F-box domain-containing protein n=1 Tax=Aspergillus ibericus CBS 121593 TaxID=1448316 RepID=A0A395H675_9EURO|nr:hypothetical protein BO80DRAFT_376327 [Aspergillus ibericus CBS 121593]RAL03401.1 hypothetical protein BO80DRAFT_376327 [Aspergillus ibericus CBS 121593]
MLTKLPPELLDMTIRLIDSRTDLRRLCEVCRRLHDITLPHLYRPLILSAPEVLFEDLVAILEKIPRKYLKYTREFGFTIPIHEQFEARCVHHDAKEHIIDDDVEAGLPDLLPDDDNVEYGTIDGETDIDESMEEGQVMDPFFDFNSVLSSLRFPDDQLRSFRLAPHYSTWAIYLCEYRWEVGTCIPEAIFYTILSNQRHIQSITLITGGECGASQYLVDLVQFRRLRSLDWKGLHRYDDFKAVRDCIKVHGHQIQSLTLDLLIWDRAEEIWTDGFRQSSSQPTRVPDNFFSQRVLNLHPGAKKIILSSLENLHLSAVSFKHTDMEMAHAFNIEHLKSLKLRNCPGSLDWVRRIHNAGKPMELKSFELGFDLDSLGKDGYTHITETICNFVQHVPNLESLYLMLPEPMNWTTLTDRLSNHRYLKLSVMHHLTDRGGQYLIDGDLAWPLHLENILQRTHLTCFGSSIPARTLEMHLPRMQPRPSCKLLHIRTSGVILDRLSVIKSGQPNWFSDPLYTYQYGEGFPYVLDEHVIMFAHWAFSADGLPDLQVIAWGDFSYGGRYSKVNLLLCRNGDGIWHLTPSNTVAWNVFQDNLDMLAACPYDDLLML